MANDQTLLALQIASRVMQLSTEDVIQFDYVASIILEEFTEMSIQEIRTWMEHCQQAQKHRRERELEGYRYRLKEEI